VATKTKTNLVPLEDRIVLRPLEGEVLAVGPGRLDDNGKRVPMEVSVGDRVLYSKYSGTEVKIDGEELLVVSQRDVLAKIGR
jgi:chaperonin GroES